ncbi:N2227-like protein-domain-containing protein [Crassisporium funariophilum]|nr:N2227-like protein-domain-containing protein [Crassisporium funariophilum]
MTFTDVRFIIASDVLLACFFPLAILFVGFKLFPSFSFSELRELLFSGPRKGSPNTHFSLTRAYHSFSQYARLSASELAQKRASYNTLGRANKNLGFKIGYAKKLDRLRDITSLNATVTDGIVELALEEFPSLSDKDAIHAGSADLGRVRESLKHFVRDWSVDGAHERTRTFAPILDLLRAVDPADRRKMKVLVPGCGLGRLAWEISQLGFDTTANELSYFMTLALRFLLSPKLTSTVNEHTLRPYGHWFSHQKSNDSLFRRISFPDAIPRLTPNFHLVEQDFMTLPVPTTTNALDDRTLSWSRSDTSRNADGGYDYIVTLFFIDTSLDVFATMRQIYHLLRPGGTWVNLGPLLWTGGGLAKVELSLDEVLQAAEEIGFVLQTEKTGLAARRTLECEYTSDSNAMMRWIYNAEFWVARKPA